MKMTSEIIRTVTEVLKQTKEGGEISSTDSLTEKVLEQLGLSIPNEIPVLISRTQRIDLAIIAVREGANIAEVVDLLTWKDFEGFVATILSENSYRCVESFRRRGNSLTQGMEIDVIGVKGDIIIAIDAKMWSIRSGKASALKKAAEKQKKRTLELTKELDRLSKKMRTLDEKVYRVFPVLVTWLVEEVELHEGVPVVPIFKLNSFILELDQYEELVVSYSGHFSKTSD
jgi:Holliday junction resolvase-like predicted endonuclease